VGVCHAPAVAGALSQLLVQVDRSLQLAKENKAEQSVNGRYLYTLADLLYTYTTGLSWHGVQCKCRRGDKGFLGLFLFLFLTISNPWRFPSSSSTTDADRRRGRRQGSRVIRMERIKSMFVPPKAQNEGEYEPLTGDTFTDGSGTLEGSVYEDDEDIAPFSKVEYSIFVLIGIAMLWAWYGNSGVCDTRAETYWIQEHVPRGDTVLPNTLRGGRLDSRKLPIGHHLNVNDNQPGDHGHLDEYSVVSQLPVPN
jgi:hypothetical protein